LKSDILSEIADSQIQEGSENWREGKDTKFKKFIGDLGSSKQGNFNGVSQYGNKEQRESLASTNKNQKCYLLQMDYKRKF
jgi:hypothetical protein